MHQLVYFDYHIRTLDFRWLTKCKTQDKSQSQKRKQISLQQCYYKFHITNWNANIRNSFEFIDNYTVSFFDNPFGSNNFKTVYSNLTTLFITLRYDNCILNDKRMKEFFYFTKGQRRGVLLFILAVIVTILTKWVL